MRNVKTKLLTPKEVASVLKVTDRTVARWCREGKMEGAVKIGRVWRIKEGFLSAWQR